MKKLSKKILVILIFLFLIVLSFIITFYKDKEHSSKHNKIKNEVLEYLNDKYNEQFNIIDFSYVKNTYNFWDDGELVTKEMKSSYIYTLKMSSSRLIEFDVLYVVYEDEDEYINNKQYDIKEAGLYENYIYEYKIRSIRSEIKEKIYDIISYSNSLDVYIDYFKEDSILMDYSLDSEETKKSYDEYRSLDKTVSNKDWFLSCLNVNDNYSLVLDINVNKYIDKNNINDFKEEVRKVVLYLEELGYSNYDINFSFKNYVSGRATKYLDNNDEQIYLIFAYVENYSDITDDDKLYAYIIDK